MSSAAARKRLLVSFSSTAAVLGLLVVVPAVPAGASTLWNPAVSSTAYLAAPAPCTDLLFVAVRGEGESSGSGKTLDLIGSNLDRGISRLHADATVTPVYVDYTTTATDSVVTSGAALPADYTTSIATGVTRLNAVLSHALADCPTQRWVLAGYSQGGAVIDQVVQNTTYTDRIAGIALVGDAGNYPAKPQVLVGDDPNASAQGLADALGTRHETPQSLAGVTWSLCSTGDVVCDWKGAADAAIPAGLDAHGDYRHDPDLKAYFAPLAEHVADLYPSL